MLVAYAQTRRRAYTCLAGLCIGLALGSKVTAALLAVPLLAGHLRIAVPDSNPPPKRIRIRAALIDMPAFWLTLLSAAVAFALTNPFALLDPVAFAASIVTQAQVTAGGVDWPFTRQYIGTLPILYYVEQQARWMLGLPLTLAAYGGLLWATRHALRAHSRPLTVVLAWVWIMLLTVGTQLVKFPRYMLPVTPILFVLAGGWLTFSAERWARKTVRVAVASILLIPSALYSLAFMEMYRSPHPWVAASEWVYRDLPPGTSIVSERWDDPLPLDLVIDGQGYLREAHIRTHLIDPFAEPDDQSKIAHLLNEVAACDYVVLSSNRLYGVIPRLSGRYPLTSAYYRALFRGDLGFVLERTFARYPNLLGVSVLDDPFRWPALPDPRPMRPWLSINLGVADESFTVYDHPLVLAFRNRDRLSPDEALSRVLAEASPEE
jgi:hypothetical protein